MIDPTASINAAQALQKEASGGQNNQNTTGTNFMEMVRDSIESTRSAQLEGETLSAKALIGEADVTQVVQAVSKAESMLTTMVTIRDRMISAFQEIMSTRI